MTVSQKVARLVIVAGIIACICGCKSDSPSKMGNSTVQSKQAEMTTYQEGDIPMLIGTYTRNMGHVDGKAKGIYLAYLRDGRVLPSEVIEVGPNPSFLVKHPVKDFVYVVHEIGGSEGEPEGQLTALTLDSLGNYMIANSRSTTGEAPCHVSVNKYGTQVYTASYGSGIVESFPIGLNGATGGQNETIKFEGSGPDPRQEAPHAHFIKEGPDGRVYAVDLGTDIVHVYTPQGGRLMPYTHNIKVSAGAGPRHIAFDKSNVYVLNELNGTIEIWQSTAGPYKHLQTIGTLSGGSKGISHSAAIKITPNGKFLYASNRTGYNNIASYAIQPNGKLEFITTTKTLGKGPRDFAIDPSGSSLLIANQDSDNIIVYKLDQRTGSLSDPIVSSGILTPVCIAFL